MKLIPQIRFKGFTDDWEERKFKDIIEKLTGGASIKPSDYLEEGIRTIPKGAVNSTGLADLSGSKYISEEFYESNKSSHVSTNNLVTSLRDLVPSAPNMGRIVRIAGEDEDFLMPQGVYKLELFDGMDEEFLIAFSNSDKYRKIISSEKNGSTQVHIRNGEFLNIDIELPFSEEQKQIGSFFKQLDNSIALHQRKLDLLKETKKGFLQKMFPKNGAKVPEIRFPGFTGNWEQRKLGEVSIRVRGNDGRMSLPTLTISAGSGWLDQRERFSNNIAGKEQKNYTLLKKGQLSYNHGNSKLAKYGAVFELRTFEEALVPRVYHSFDVSKAADTSFVEYLFATKKPDRELRKLISSGARMDGLLNINYDDFMGIDITIPSKDEQSKIAGFLRELDAAITLHQRKLDLLKETKKGFLQKMF